MEFRDLKEQYLRLKDKMDLAISKVLTDGQYIFGKEVVELERQLATYVGRKYCVSCANGTDAITLLLKSWGIGEGDAVFVPDVTFIASAGAASVLGITPIFVDVDLNTFNISPIELENAIKIILKEGKLKPKAIVAVDLFGLSANYFELEKIAQKYDLKILEDCAQGFGGSIDGKMNCSFGDGATTSFFPAKPLGCYGDGGAIFLDDKSIYDDLLSLRAQGRAKDDKYNNYQIGINSRLDTLQAAILLVKFDAYRKFELEQINTIAMRYNNQLFNCVKIPIIPKGYVSAYAQYCILLENNRTREELAEFLKTKDIPTMVYYPKPLHLQLAFKNVAREDLNYNNSIKMSDTILALPLSPYLKEDDQTKVCNCIKEFFERRKS